jgi:hypothetical protein
VSDSVPPEIAALREVLTLQGKLLAEALERSRPVKLSEQLAELRALAEIVRPEAPAAPAAPAMPAAADAPTATATIADRIIGILDRIIAGADKPKVSPATSGTPARLPPWLKPFAPAIPYVARLALMGDPPDVAAAALWAHVPADARAGLATIFARDDYPSCVINAVPAFAERQDWLTMFLYALRGQAPAAEPSPAAGEGVA